MGWARCKVDRLVDQLVLLVYADMGFTPGRRRAVGPYRAVIVVLYLRHNLSQALLAELFGCSQPTVSRLVGQLLPVITTVLTHADQVAAKALCSTVRVDGFLVPTGDRRTNPPPQACIPVSGTGAGSTCRSSARPAAPWC
jgi:hypothetical protein